MPLDAICLHAVVGEIAPQIEGARIEKIQQPSRDQVILLLRGNRRLLLNAGANQPRLHLTGQLRDNPTQPPMFCMLLRKHLSGGRITAVEQEPLERVVTLHITAADEMGEQSAFHLILEAMGRHSNLILTDRDNRIIDCMRRVDFEMSQERQVLPGLYYRLPPKQGKRSPLDIGKDAFLQLLSACPDEKQADAWLLETFTAISPLIAREIVYRACGATDARAFAVREQLWDSFFAWQSSVKENNFTPVVIKRDKKYTDYAYLDIRQYGAYAVSEICDSFCAMLDAFYEGREQAERVRQKGQDLMKAADPDLDQGAEKSAPCAYGNGRKRQENSRSVPSTAMTWGLLGIRYQKVEGKVSKPASPPT